MMDHGYPGVLLEGCLLLFLIFFFLLLMSLFFLAHLYCPL